MISKFEICKKSGCSIIIQDTSSFYSNFTDNRELAYEDTITVNVIKKHTIEDDDILLETLIVPHTLDYDECDIEEETIEGVVTTPMKAYLDESHYTFKQDGYYTIYHIIVPTLEGYYNMLEKDPDFFNDYHCVIVYDNGVFKEIHDDDIFEVKLDTIHTIYNDPYLDTTVACSHKEIFIKCHLEDCYVDYSKKLLEAQLRNCTRNIEGQFERDFLWMTLNVINYYIEYGQYNEAQRILEQVNYCNGFCNNNNKDCGCNNKKKQDCGCNK